MNDFENNREKMKEFSELFDDLDIGQAFIGGDLTSPCLFCVNDDDDCFTLKQGKNKKWFIEKTSLDQFISATEIAVTTTFEEALDIFVQTVTYDDCGTFEELKAKNRVRLAS